MEIMDNNGAAVELDQRRMLTEGFPRVLTDDDNFIVLGISHRVNSGLSEQEKRLLDSAPLYWQQVPTTDDQPNRIWLEVNPDKDPDDLEYFEHPRNALLQPSTFLTPEKRSNLTARNAMLAGAVIAAAMSAGFIAVVVARYKRKSNVS